MALVSAVRSLYARGAFSLPKSLRAIYRVAPDSGRRVARRVIEIPNWVMTRIATAIAAEPRSRPVPA